MVFFFDMKRKEESPTLFFVPPQKKKKKTLSWKYSFCDVKSRADGSHVGPLLHVGEQQSISLNGRLVIESSMSFWGGVFGNYLHRAAPLNVTKKKNKDLLKEITCG